MMLLLIEDADADLDACKTTQARWNDEHDAKAKIDLVEKRSLSEALYFLRSYESTNVDGIILDLSLDRRGDAGEAIISAMSEMKRRIPVYVFTATPDALSFPYVLGKKKKGDCTYDEIFNAFDMVQKTGLSKILGNGGSLEDCLKRIFDHSIMPYIRFWSEYAVNAGTEESERALARHVSLQLHDAMDGDCDKFAPNEFYVTNLDDGHQFVRSGELLMAKGSKTFYVVLTPPCDLVVHAGAKKPKSKTVLIGELEDADKMIGALTKLIRKKREKEGVDAAAITEEVSNIRHSIESNKHCLYYHYFPMAMGLPSLLLNYRELMTRSHDEIANDYVSTGFRVAPSFFRDVLARFSSYYGRQGQPELNLANNG